MGTDFIFFCDAVQNLLRAAQCRSRRFLVPDPVKSVLVSDEVLPEKSTEPGVELKAFYILEKAMTSFMQSYAFPLLNQPRNWTPD